MLTIWDVKCYPCSHVTGQMVTDQRSSALPRYRQAAGNLLALPRPGERQRCGCCGGPVCLGETSTARGARAQVGRRHAQRCPDLAAEGSRWSQARFSVAVGEAGEGQLACHGPWPWLMRARRKNASVGGSPARHVSQRHARPLPSEMELHVAYRAILLAPERDYHESSGLPN